MPRDAQRAKAAIEKIEQLHKILRTGSCKASQVASIRGHMDDLQDILSRYFHGTNLRKPTIRPVVLALRKIIRGAMSGRDPLLRIYLDQIVFRPQLHRAVATQCARLGEVKCELTHLRAAARAGPISNNLRSALEKAVGQADSTN